MTEYLYLNAAKGQNKGPRPPIWFMRQAGRYMPEYQAVRKKHGFQTMIRTPELATEITLQPIDFFGFDAAILFSDILVMAEALGSQLHFVEKKGPVIDNPIRTLEDVKSLPSVTAHETVGYVFEAIKLLRPELDRRQRPLIGFSGAPFTVASYMIEGGSCATLEIVKKMIGNDPLVLQALIDTLTALTIEYLSGQVDAGVQALQLFDTWAGQLAWQDFHTYSLNPMKTIITEIKRRHDVPITVFCKNSALFAEDLKATGADVIGIDWQGRLTTLRSRLGTSVALQGNLDPQLLFASPAILESRILDILNEMADDPGYIFNLGHGILPTIPVENVRLAVELVQTYQI